MLYWPTNTNDVVWPFPNHLSLTEETLPDEMYLEVRNDVGLWVIDGEIGDSEVTPGYIIWKWRQDIEEQLPPVGEYTYALYGYRYDLETDSWCGAQLLDTGLLFVGDFAYEPAQLYEEIAVEYEQYGEQAFI